VFDEEEQVIFISLLQKYLAHNVAKNNKLI
jgi:hypothetical protein